MEPFPQVYWPSQAYVRIDIAIDEDRVAHLFLRAQMIMYVRRGEAPFDLMLTLVEFRPEVCNWQDLVSTSRFG